MDAGLQRPKAILFVGSCGFLLGLPSAFSLNFLNNQDWVWGLGLILSGIFVAFAAIKYGVDKFRTELVNSEGNDIAAGAWFNFIVKIIIPIEFVALLGWWFWQTIAGDPEGWWAPFKTYSLGTVLLQWAIALVVLVAAGNWLYKKTVKV
jgi:NSS family neurotransmitter:Na+ symporter